MLVGRRDASDKEVRVHDVIRDMALCVASLSEEKKLEWIVQPGVGLEKVQNSDAGIWTRASRISLMCNCIKELPQSPNCPNLLLLTLQQNFHLKAISPGFFRTMRALTFLDLSWTCIRELPREIGSLVKLQYLSLRNSDIVSLPLELGFLTELRFLNLSYTDHLKTIPRGVISKLSMLQFLNLFKSKYSGFEMEIHKSTETKYDLRQTSNEKSEFSLEELHYLGKGLKSLGISQHHSFECQKLFRVRRVVDQKRTSRSVCWQVTFEARVPHFLAPLQAEEGPLDGAAYEASSGHYCRELQLSQHFLDTEDPVPRTTRSIILLQFGEVIGHAEDANDLMHAFSRLRIVQLHHLPRLERFCAQKLALPSLEYLDVYGCPLLQELPFQLEASRVSRLRRIRGEKGWSDQLELGDNDTARRTFQSFFKVFENSLETFEPDLDTNPFMSSASSFFARREPMVRTALQFSAYLALIFGDQMPLEIDLTQRSSKAMALLPFFGSIVTVVLSQLWNPLVLHLGYPVKVGGNVKKLTIFTKRLQARRDDIKAQIDIAERRHKTCKHEAKEWLQSVETIEGEVEAVKHAYDERCRCCGEFSLDIIGKHRISRRAAKKLKRVMELFDQGGAFEEIAVELPPPPIEEMPIASAVIGMQSNLEKILRHLKDDEVGAVGVWEWEE
uniref:Disease resistance R13L4/SHOC-2-like LRR domain-containing protein n=1 Tax=Ananas comosus var. bracteatus TaxID=296719 RepID=A0A6V7Q8Z9_ANACO|nr:unnamed protein product [Ananas comosus var. bracteatus]